MQTNERLEEQLRQLELMVQIDAMKSVLGSDRVQEAFGDTVDNSDALWATPGYGGAEARISVGYDRKSGDNPPFWLSEQEHAEARGIARYLAQVDETLIGASENLTNYCIGTGAEVTFESQDKSVAATAQRVWRAWCDEHGFDGMTEREIFKRLFDDGERALWVKPRAGQKLPGFCIVEPEWITEPDKRSADLLEETYDLPDCDWKYGIARTSDWSERFVGIFAERYGESGDWEFIPQSQLLWTTANVVGRVKRGMPDAFPVYKDLEKIGKVYGATLIGAAIQACIAVIKEHAPGVSSSSISAASPADYTFQKPTSSGGTTTKRVKRYTPGMTLDVSNGLQYKAGPMGSGAGVGFIEIAQAGVRRLGVRWQMPEYMISGDASNANYSSSLVAESPFVKACEARQYVEQEDRRRLIWLVLAHAARAGAFAQHGIGTAEDLRLACDVSVKLPEPQSRDTSAEAELDRLDYEIGAVSAQTVCEKRGRSYEEEVKRGAKASPSAALPPLPNVAPANPLGAVPAVTPEQVQEAIVRAVKQSWEEYP